MCIVCSWLEGEVFFFQLVASFLVELEATVMVAVVWLCCNGGGGFCCGLGIWVSGFFFPPTVD